ncbi:UNVERIFIED_CONTAM: Chromatin assembly factor 1 subunit FAS1 [Sesamum calycinum]|uniref:Chromatin assembly factor 1 subunit FAS1 n=1 Tax=Sesamum calycinum TaxID=2727403 RepID=A0AAW2RT51_9LAMI
MENMSQKNGAEMAGKEAKREEKLLIKQMEKNKREMEKERKKMDRVLQKEKMQSEKELKRLHEEAEKEERRRQKEENDMQKQLKRQQEDAEKDQRRREKEEAEMRKQLALQKQASLMERFLKRNKTDSTSQNDSSMSKATTSGSSANMLERTSESVTLVMDSVLAQNGGLEVTLKCLVPHWTFDTFKQENALGHSEVCGGWVDPNVDGRLSQMNTDSSPLPSIQKRSRAKQLLQFDKSHRPAFYGVCPRKSQVVGPRHPFVKDPDIDYEIDSDEEWEEDEPGESLSDSEKDEEDESAEGHLKDDDEEESEDGFFVPDGYLSENEGVKADEVESDDLVEEVRNLPNPEQQVQSEEFCTLLRQQKYLKNLTEHALKKNQPLIILNLMHEKTTLFSAEELTGTEKLERMCLQTLSMRPLPGFPDIEISAHNDAVDEDQEAFSAKSSTKLLATAAALADSDLPQIVNFCFVADSPITHSLYSFCMFSGLVCALFVISAIQSCPHSIGKITKSLHNKFPDVPKSQIRNKVREISEFSDNRWQVKKEVLSKHGLAISPEKTCGKTKSIATFLKRCLPPSGTTLNLSESSPQSSQKRAATVEPPRDVSFEH